MRDCSHYKMPSFKTAIFCFLSKHVLVDVLTTVQAFGLTLALFCCYCSNSTFQQIYLASDEGNKLQLSPQYRGMANPVTNSLIGVNVESTMKHVREFSRASDWVTASPFHLYIHINYLTKVARTTADTETKLLIIFRKGRTKWSQAAKTTKRHRGTKGR